MSIKTMGGTSLIPLLSRFVLGVTFFLSGCFFCFQTIEMSSEDMARLQQSELTKSAESDAPTEITDASNELAVARIQLHLVAWELGQWGKPLSWAIAIFQLLGGACLLIGLCTRIAALGLCILIGGAFWQLTIQQNGMFEISPFAWRDHSAAWYTMLSQLPMLILAFGLLLTGGGPMCVDTLLFGRAPQVAKGKSKKGVELE